MASKKKPTKTTAPPTTRSTRSTTKAAAKVVNTESAEPTENSADPNSTLVLQDCGASTHASPLVTQQKRKRAMTDLSEQGGQVAPQKKPHTSNLSNPTSDETNDEKGRDNTVKRSTRIAPARPKFSSELGSGEEDEGQASDRLTSSDMELDALTAKQIYAERPIPVPNHEPAAGTHTKKDATVRGSSNTGKVGRRAKQVLDEVPSVVQSPLSIEGDSSGAIPDTTPLTIPPVDPVPVSTSTTVLPDSPPPALALAAFPPLLPHVWPAATDLVVGEDNRLQQSAQSPEINKCISKAVRLANSKIFFDNAFPNLEDQNKWVTESLVAVLRDQAKTDLVVREVNLRAQQDKQYLASLVSMMTNRWSVARQGVIDAARALIISKGCTYAVSKLAEADRAVEVAKLLDSDAFHFGKTSLGTVNKAAPYQHPEIASGLSHFFRVRNNFGSEYLDKFHRGKYGLQMPQPMVALIATAIQAALMEWETGVRVKRAFTEINNREAYREHLAAIQLVRDSVNGQSKYERLLSKIYTQTMNHLHGENPPATSAPKKKSVIDVDSMEA